MVWNCSKSAGKIQCELSPEGKQLWASRYIKNFVVLMDWDSTVSAVKSSKSTTIEVLQSILLNVSVQLGVLVHHH